MSPISYFNLINFGHWSVTVIGPLIYWETERGTTARPSIDRVLGRPTANYFLIRALNTGTMSGVSNFVLTTATSASI